MADRASGGADDPAAMDRLWLVNLLTVGMDAITVVPAPALAVGSVALTEWGARRRTAAVESRG
ncbi:hypothetical protein ACFRAR_10075 [Kitasatospora sp. NPDC056651]|uniref:hypothetical protein n=1 Tax=Kitasatospora sp. NPDC056651 TaxID=3345892 RepID=UPI0036BD1AE8